MRSIPLLAVAAWLALSAHAGFAQSPAAQAAYAKAQHFNGLTGQAFDRAQALHHMRQAAELGHVAAQVELAFLHFNGSPQVPRDLAAAHRWFQAAAATGSLPAQCMLGDFHRDGLGGVQANPVEAVKWYQRVAASTDRCAPKAQYALYASYESGRGVRKDLVQAMAWLRKAAEGGNPQAQRTLGRAYEQGWGVERDPRLAVAWLRKSREGVAPHDDHDHGTPKCPPWMHGELQKRAGCVS
jgi:TPR repeat protein